MKEKKDWVEIVTKSVIWILGIVLIYMLVLKILGHSPIYETIFGVALGVIVAQLFNMSYKVGKLEGDIASVKNTFHYVKEDINKINNNLIKIDHKLKI